MVSGKIYRLIYLDNNDLEKTIEMYSSDEFEHKTNLFLNTYFKNKLSEEAKVPIEESSSCFIATACYQDVFSPEVVAFRQYRDKVLKRSIAGVLFVKCYYKISPLIYIRLYKSPKINSIIKKGLDKIYTRITKVSNNVYEK